MNLRPRDRRALAWLAVSALLGLVIHFWPANDSPTAVVASVGDPVALAESRLARLRDTAATVPAKESVLKKVSAELAGREKGIIQADTAAQAQAQVIQIVRGLGAAETPPIEIRSTELTPVRPFGDSYGEASVAVQIECRIDQLVNLLAALQAEPRLVATTDLRVLSSNAKEKTVSVRLAVSGVVPRRLVGEKPQASKKAGRSAL
jgi:hypothetical protein